MKLGDKLDWVRRHPLLMSSKEINNFANLLNQNSYSLWYVFVDVFTIMNWQQKLFKYLFFKSFCKISFSPKENIFDFMHETNIYFIHEEMNKQSFVALWEYQITNEVGLISSFSQLLFTANTFSYQIILPWYWKRPIQFITILEWVITWIISFYTCMINILDSFYGNKNANNKISVVLSMWKKSLINIDGIWP